MILKMIINDAWVFRDHIDELHIIPPGCYNLQGYSNADVKRVVRYTRNHETETQPLYDSAYLLNDEGKTIECLVL